MPIPFFVHLFRKQNCGFLNSSLHMCKMELYNRRVKTIILLRLEDKSNEYPIIV